MIIDKINKKDLNYIKDEENDKGVLGITHNRIVEVPNFVSPELVPKMLRFFEDCDVDWGDIAFYGSSGKGILTDIETMRKFDLPDNLFEDLKNKFMEAVEVVFDRKVKANTSHAQKWDVCGFASPHSDNSDYDGNPNAFEINKYVAILYLNGDYDGGELYFCKEENGKQVSYLSFKPNAYSLYTFPGGVENIHGVSEITKGTRYTMVSFWDYADAEYSQETLDRWEEEEKQVRIQQAAQKEEWAKGNTKA
jgi:hypothetical protein